MISQSAFSHCHYRQQLQTCVLASYAVAATPFVGIPVLDFFNAYCREHGLPQQHPERNYDLTFHGMGRGYGVVWKLHHHSPVGVFQSCRSKFDLEDVHGVDLAAIEQRLTSENATLMLFINKSKRTDLRLGDMHSIAVACDPNGRLFYYDTGLGKAVENFGTLADLGECGDRFLLIGKP